jgi:glycosyltransferase involved in cell wall biosynthesis
LQFPKIDVIMPTWNSNGWWFRDVLNSVAKNCNLCHLIVVDRHSTDGTQEILKMIIPREKLIIIESDANLASARQVGISHVDTHIFAFVDSDIELCENWETKMCSTLFQEGIGAVQGMEADDYEAREVNLATRELIPFPSLKARMIIRHGLFNLVRGMTTQTLIKTEIVRDWKPEPFLCSFEDFSLTQYLLSKGFKWVRAVEVVSKHHKYPKKGENEFKLIHGWYLWNGAGAKASGRIPFNLVVMNSLFRIAGGFTRYLFQKISLRQMFFIVLMQFSIMEGFLFSKKYLVNSR